MKLSDIIEQAVSTYYLETGKTPSRVALCLDDCVRLRDEMLEECPEGAFVGADKSGTGMHLHAVDVILSTAPRGCPVVLP
jgi:hypothetical protein